ncbi:MAG: hypothetical protein ACXWKP_28870 [Bradyrhizobium sp.]
MQSAVTGFTKALKTELGRKLFDRYSNSATPTFDGKQCGVAGSCRRRLDRWSDVADLDFMISLSIAPTVAALSSRGRISMLRRSVWTIWWARQDSNLQPDRYERGEP